MAATRVGTVPELVCAVLQHVPRYPPTTLLAAATVNRCWSEFALDGLWREVDGSLFMPELPFTREPNIDPANITFDKARTELFVRHARRIRKLWLVWSFSPVIEFLAHLAETRQMPAFNLHELYLGFDGEHTTLHGLEPLLSSNLKRITLDFGECECPPGHSEFLATLTTMAPNLQHVAVRNILFTTWCGIANVVHASLLAMAPLNSILFPDWALSAATVAAYASAGVTAIECTHNTPTDDGWNYGPRWWRCPPSYVDGMPDPDLSPPPPTASASSGTTRSPIRDLTLFSSVQGLTDTLLRRLDTTNLTELDIALTSTDDTCAGLADAIHGLGRTSAGLHHFRLAAPNVVADPSAHPPGATSPLPRMDWAVLAPLTACRRMQAFAVLWDTPIRVSKDEFAAMARAWPALVSLRLWARRPPPTDYAEPALSMAALPFLSAHCPAIEDVSLIVSPVGVPTGDLGAIQKLSNLVRRDTCELRIWLPAPDDDALVADTRRFLCHLLPEATMWFERSSPVLEAFEPLAVYEPAEDAVATPGAYDSVEWREWVAAVRCFGRKLGKLTPAEIVECLSRERMNAWHMSRLPEYFDE